MDKHVIDEMIRARAGHGPCAGVKPLPVVWRMRPAGGCNWSVSGWVGDLHAVRGCTEHLAIYLRSLRAQFDIPEEG